MTQNTKSKKPSPWEQWREESMAKVLPPLITTVNLDEDAVEELKDLRQEFGELISRTTDDPNEDILYNAYDPLISPEDVVLIERAITLIDRILEEDVGE